MIDDLLVMVATISTPTVPAGTDPMGDPVSGPSTPTSYPCWCEQASTDEVTAGRDLTRRHWTLYTGPDAVITATSTVTIDAYPGLVFAVDGEPFRWVLPITGEPSHIEAQLVVTS